LTRKGAVAANVKKRRNSTFFKWEQMGFLWVGCSSLICDILQKFVLLEKRYKNFKKNKKHIFKVKTGNFPASPSVYLQ